MTIRLMKKEDAKTIARIHQQALPDTFLSSLGFGFLTAMYSAQADDPESIVLIEEEQKEDNQKILGFVSGTVNSDQFIKRIILSSPIKLSWKIGFQIIKNPFILKKIFQTLKYGKLCHLKDTNVELIAIAVIPNIQRSGIGTLLLNALLEELKLKGIKKIKVLVGQELVGAQSFYKKHHFTLNKTVELYGQKKNILIRDR